MLRGEIGVLTHVVPSKTEPHTRCYLLIDFKDERYMGTLLFDNAAFCCQVSNLLENHIGKLIKEIGDLDLSYTL